MAGIFKLTDDDKQKLKDYGSDNWPPILSSHDVELYFRMQWLTIAKTYGSRPDWPAFKAGDRWQVPYADLKGFISAYASGRMYEGLSDVVYGEVDK